MALVEQTLKKDILKVGSTIKLVSYNHFNDYVRHYNEEATVVDIFAPGALSIRVKWKNGEASCVSPVNIVLVNKDWDS